MSITPPIKHKIVLLGNMNVGKTSIAVKFVKNLFLDNYESTIGAMFLTKTIQLPDKTVKFEIWDTAGQERYKSLLPMYYRNSDAAIIVYDITDRQSFEQAKKWVSDLTDFDERIDLKILVGNKCDLKSNREVPTEMVEKYCYENNLLFLETSAKSDVNISNIFVKLAQKLPDHSRRAQDDMMRTGITINRSGPSTTKSRKCCVE